MLSNWQLATCLLVIVGGVWASSFELAVRADNSSVPSNATAATTSSLRPSSTIPLPSSNSTIASNTATPSVGNSLPVLALPVSSYNGNGEAEFTEFAEKCHRIDEQDDKRDGNFVFCQPMHLQNITATEAYPFIWDSRAFESNAINEISLNYVDNPENVPLISATNVSNSIGFVQITMEKTWLREGKSTNLTVFITSSYEGSNKPSSGPTIVLVPDEDEDPTPKKKVNKVGLGVGIPFAFGAVAVIALGAFCCIRKRRRSSTGYSGSKSRSAMPVDDDDFDGVGGGMRGSGRFRDEPSSGGGIGGGLELQDRSTRGRGRGEDDSLGSLTSTPTEDYGGRGNAFRDEISRQRTLRG